MSLDRRLWPHWQVEWSQIDFLLNEPKLRLNPHIDYVSNAVKINYSWFTQIPNGWPSCALFGDYLSLSLHSFWSLCHSWLLSLPLCCSDLVEALWQGWNESKAVVICCSGQVSSATRVLSFFCQKVPRLYSQIISKHINYIWYVLFSSRSFV